MKQKPQRERRKEEKKAHQQKNYMKKYLRNIVGAIVKREEHEKNEDKIKSLKKGMLRLSTVQTHRKREHSKK